MNRTGIIALTVLAAAAVSATIMITTMLNAPSADTLVERSIVARDPLVDTPLEIQLVNDLGVENGIAHLERKQGNFYDFGLSVRGDEGGVEVIAYMQPNGQFTKVWEGQGIPPCGVIGSEVPAGIVPYCFRPVLLDRSNIVRTLYTLLANPYIDRYGQIHL